MKPATNAARGPEQGIQIWHHGLVDPKRNTARVEANAGSRIAQQEDAHSGHPVGCNGRKRAIEATERRLLMAESSVRKPEAGAHVGAVGYPGKVDANDEQIRFTRRPHMGGFS